MRTTLAAIAASVALIATPILTAAPAQADTPGCVSRNEFGLVKKGWTKARVHRLFDTSGQQYYYSSAQYGFPAEQWREYDGCPEYSWIDVDYVKRNGVWYVTSKDAIW